MRDRLGGGGREKVQQGKEGKAQPAAGPGGRSPGGPGRAGPRRGPGEAGGRPGGGAD